MPYKDKQKMREYQSSWSKKRRDEWIDSQGGCCAKCGSADNLEVDHIDPAKKKYNPREIWNRRAEVRLLELENCQVLCQDCHLKKTTEYRTPDHGTNSRYGAGCRCELCKLAHRDKAREFRAAGKKW